MEPPSLFSYLFARLLQADICSDYPVIQKIQETTGMHIQIPERAAPAWTCI